MSKKKGTHKYIAGKRPGTDAPKPTEEHDISDNQLDNVAGGFNPQPDPPKGRHTPLVDKPGGH